MPSTILSDNGVSSGTSGIKTTGSNDGALALQTTTAGGTATTAISIDTGQRTKFPTTIAVGDATPSTSGSGITFPATQSASTDANTLDDYEEGTFTPTVVGSASAGTGTYTNQVGRYTKIGRLVTVDVYLKWTAHTGTGDMYFGNLPFTNNGATNAAGSVSYVNNIALTANNILTIYTEVSNTRVICNQYPVGGGVQSPVALDTAGELVFTVTYSV